MKLIATKGNRIVAMGSNSDFPSLASSPVAKQTWAAIRRRLDAFHAMDLVPSHTVPSDCGRAQSDGTPRRTAEIIPFSKVRP